MKKSIRIVKKILLIVNMKSSFISFVFIIGIVILFWLLFGGIFSSPDTNYYPEGFGDQPNYLLSP